jgi:hypothetical protein
MEERSAVTSSLLCEALARGDMGIAVACMSPAAASTAISLWGDADQQARYLHEFVSDDIPAAALALLEPQPLFNPCRLKTRARREGGDYVLTGTKSLVPRARDAELFVVAAELEDQGPALFVVESKVQGIGVEPEPAMGIRAAATGTLSFDAVRVPGSAALGAGDPETFKQCVQLARLAWCALAVGTAQAVLDYVIPYVNERQAFGEPIANRQACRSRWPTSRSSSTECASRPTAQLAAPTKASRSAERSRWLDGCARSAGCKSVQTAFSCWEATATSRNTRSSGGTAICAPPD